MYVHVHVHAAPCIDCLESQEERGIDNSKTRPAVDMHNVKYTYRHDVQKCVLHVQNCMLLLSQYISTYS